MCKNKLEFTAAVARYRKLSAEKKKVEAELGLIKADMEEYIKKKGVPGGKNGLSLVVFGDGYKVTLIPLENVTYDGDKLKAVLGPDLEQYKRIKPYSKIDVRS